MPLAPIDISIVALYLLAAVILAWFFSRRAGRNLETYFLGGKRIPWYLVGISHGVSGLDVSGTMWFALMLFVYGVKGVYILWIWPMFAMVFRMVYLGPWIRRSNALTGAEWMHTRFSRRGGAELAHLSVVAYALVGAVAFLSYAFQGIGKFAAAFFPWDLPPETYATVILALATAYLVIGGMYSVLVTDLLQYLLLVVSAVGIAIVACLKTSPEMIDAVVPAGWHSLAVGWHLELDWSQRMPLLQRQLHEDGWSLFTVFLTLMLIKGWMVSMAGPSPGHGMQRVLATRSPREAALESWWISVVVLFPRFLLIASIVVLALGQLMPQLNGMQAAADYEQLLPLVIRDCLPVGLTGVAVAGFVAAFVSMFAATVHAGTAYLVNDVYKRYLRPNDGAKSYVYASYAGTILLVLVGITFGCAADSISSVTKWLVSMLFGGYTAPNLLKWHWWRFNGYGFFAGMLTGVAAAMAMPLLFPTLTPLYAFPFIFAVSTVASVVACLLTAHESTDVLDRFYLTVRPWGYWEPVLRRLRQQYPDLEPNRNFRRDMLNCAIGVAWQTSIVLLPIYLVLRDRRALAVTAACCAVLSLVLKRTWYDRLEEQPDGPS